MNTAKKQWMAPVATEIEVNGGPTPTTTGESAFYHVS